MFCHGPILDTSRGNRDFRILESAQVGRVPSAVEEILVVVGTLKNGYLHKVPLP
jgi:hypothetical protein